MMGPSLPDGSAAPDRQCGSQCFNDRHDRTNHSLAVINCLDDFRYAVTFRFWGEVLDQKYYSECPDDRDNNHKPTPGACGCMHVRVVDCGESAKEEKIMNDPNEGSECHRSQPSHDSYQQRERPQDCRPDRSRRCCAVRRRHAYGMQVIRHSRVFYIVVCRIQLVIPIFDIFISNLHHA